MKINRLVVRTLNIRRGLMSKMSAIQRALSSCHILALQEADSFARLKFKKNSHSGLPPEGAQGYDVPRYGQWLLLSKKSKLTRVSQTALIINGQIHGQVYVLASPFIDGKILLLNVHLPTGIDSMHDDNPILASIKTSLTNVLSSVNEYQHVMVLGDFNETDSLALDRSNPGAYGGQGRISSVLKSYGLMDAYRAIHGTGGHTFCDPRSSHTSRIDKVWVKGQHLLIVGAAVSDVDIKSDHNPLTIFLNIPAAGLFSHSAMRLHSIPLKLLAESNDLKKEFAKCVQARLSESNLPQRFNHSCSKVRNQAWADLCHLLTEVACKIANGKKRSNFFCDETDTLNRAIDAFSNLVGHVSVLSDIMPNRYSNHHRALLSSLPLLLRPPIHLVVGGEEWNAWMEKLIARRNTMSHPAEKLMTEKELFAALRRPPARQVDSVVHQGTVTFDPTIVKTVMWSKYTALFGIESKYRGIRPEFVEKTLESGRELEKQDFFRHVFDTTP